MKWYDKINAKSDGVFMYDKEQYQMNVNGCLCIFMVPLGRFIGK